MIMNYYIQGDAEKADQISAAFEKLGYDTSRHLFNAKSVLYFTLNGEIRATTCNCTPAIIKSHPDYKELELPVKPEFKVGIWIVGNEGIFKITQYEDEHGYDLTDTAGCVVHFVSPDYVESNFHLWSIADAKDGDVLATTKIRNCPFIYRKIDYNNNLAYYYAGVDGDGDFREGCLKRTLFHFGSVAYVAPATKEQRDLLFAKMREAGYEWDADKKELRKIKPHYDIANFKPFDKVMVRCGNDEEWMIEFYCKYDTLVHTQPHRDYPFMGIGDSYSQCIPFNDDTKHLLGTTDMCDECYVNW